MDPHRRYVPDSKCDLCGRSTNTSEARREISNAILESSPSISCALPKDPDGKHRPKGSHSRSATYKRVHASLNGRRGRRGNRELGSPYPMLQRKFDLT